MRWTSLENGEVLKDRNKTTHIALCISILPYSQIFLCMFKGGSLCCGNHVCVFVYLIYSWIPLISAGTLGLLSQPFLIISSPFLSVSQTKMKNLLDNEIHYLIQAFPLLSFPVMRQFKLDLSISRLSCFESEEDHNHISFL